MSELEIITFGCRLNAYESEVMREHANGAGLSDAVIVNTCAVTGEAVRQAAMWQQQGRAMTVSVNVSALQFQQADFVERVAQAVSSAGLRPELLELELTETILVKDADEALSRLQALSALGVRLAIDDFGTGYSSLGYLKRFPIEKLKIDLSFINGLPGDESDAAIVRAIIHMARALHLRVIAEGVETDLQRQFLASAGCDEVQGFLYSPAVPADQFEDWLAAPPQHEPVVQSGK